MDIEFNKESYAEGNTVFFKNLQLEKVLFFSNYGIVRETFNIIHAIERYFIFGGDYL